MSIRRGADGVLIINVGDTDENADWIKSLPGHAGEIEACEEALRMHRAEMAAKGEPVESDDDEVLETDSNIE